MQFTNAILALLAAADMAMAAPRISARQAGLDRVNGILRDARSASMTQIENGGGRGRMLSGGSCSTACSQCQTGAVTAAVGEIGLCGVAALAAEASSAGVATILTLTGFAACETAVIGNLNKAESECKTMP